MDQAEGLRSLVRNPAGGADLGAGAAQPAGGGEPEVAEGHIDFQRERGGG